jgi:hypothetical protein
MGKRAKAIQSRRKRPRDHAARKSPFLPCFPGFSPHGNRQNPSLRVFLPGEPAAEESANHGEKRTKNPSRPFFDDLAKPV